jgi:hypothetical protein
MLRWCGKNSAYCSTLVILRRRFQKNSAEFHENIIKVNLSTNSSYQYMSENLFSWYFENKSGKNSSFQGFDYKNSCLEVCDAV